MLDAANDRGVMEADAGLVDRALATFAAVAHQARGERLGEIWRTALSNRVACLLKAGRWEAVLTEAQAALEAGRHSASWRNEASVLSMVADAQLKLGRPREALEAVERSLALKRQFDDVRLGFTLVRRAEIYECLGEHEAARADVVEALDHSQRHRVEDQRAYAELFAAILGARTFAGPRSAVQGGLAEAVERARRSSSQPAPHSQEPWIG